MVDWASFEFDLSKADKNGITQRAHFEQVEKSTGRKPTVSENPYEFPICLSHVWSYFLELQSARTSGFNGPNPLTYQEIESWVRLTGSPVTPKEIECIKRIDNEYLKVAHNG